MVSTGASGTTPVSAFEKNERIRTIFSSIWPFRELDSALE